MIELMLVLGIIAALLIATGRRIYKGEETPATIIRKFAVLSRQVHTQAKLNGVTYRIVISMDEERQDGSTSGAHAFWVEKASSTEPILLNDPEAEEETSIFDDEDEENPAPNPFQVDTAVMPEAKVLPRDLIFKHVETEAYSDVVENGRAYIHFFPQGLIEENVIQLTNDRGLQWSLAIHPLTGKTDFIKDHIELEDLRED